MIVCRNQQIQRQRISLKTNANRLGWFLNEANVIRVDHNTVDSLESEVEEAQSRLNAILDSKYLPVMLEINKTERTAELQTIYTKYYETALELIRKDVSTVLNKIMLFHMHNNYLRIFKLLIRA